MQSSYYLWIKWLHLVAMVSWFAGLFYLPRLFVYHTETEEAVGRSRFALMERKLYKFIMLPAALVTIASGGFLWLQLRPLGMWIDAKIFFVLILVAFHWQCGREMANLSAGLGRTHRWYRWFNEVPTVCLVCIVWIVIFKPWSA